MKNKPVKFGIRFYALAGWKHTYLHSLWDNGRGNKLKFSPASRYCSVFQDMRQSFDTFITNDPEEIILPDLASALWSLQISKMHQVLKSPSGVFMDNYYTRHPFARKIKHLTNDEIKVIGTIKLNSLDTYNKTNVVRAIEMMNDVPMGSWILVQCFDSKPKRSEKKKKVKLESKKSTSAAKRRKKMMTQKNLSHHRLLRTQVILCLKTKKL